MSDTQFVIASLISAYCSGWAFGAIFLYYRKLMEQTS